MKKFLAFLFVVALVVGLAGSAQAILYEEIINLGEYFDSSPYFDHMGNLTDTSGTGEVYYGGFFTQGTDPVTWDWSFTTPADFKVPFDTVNLATVDVVVGWIDTVGDDQFWVETLSLIGLGENTATYTLDIGSLFLSWPSLGTVDCSLVIVEDERWNGDLFLGNSTFTLDYENGAPVPEPATMLLMGTGLVGLAGIGRKKLFRKQ